MAVSNFKVRQAVTRYGRLKSPGWAMLALLVAAGPAAALGTLATPQVAPITQAAENDEPATTPVAGFFQTSGARWARTPKGLTRLLSAESLHYSPSSDPGGAGMSTSFFPQTDLQIADLEKLLIDQYLAAGSVCTAGSPRITIAVEDPLNPPASPQDETQVYVHLDSAAICSTESWQTLDFLDPKQTYWAASQIGAANTDQAGAHAAALTAVGADYRVGRVRFNFDGGSGPQAWFDNQRINANQLRERVNDWSPNSQTPDTAPLITALPVNGYFQSRNQRWGKPPPLLQRLPSAEALEFSPATHAPGENHASVSFFPQGRMQISDLSTLRFDVSLPMGSSCTGGGLRAVVTVEDPANPPATTGQEVKANIILRSADRCPEGGWATLNMLNPKLTEWELVDGASGVRLANHADQATAHSAAVAHLGPGYQLGTIRVVMDGGTGPVVWLDNIFINDNSLRERVQDMSPEAQIPAPPAATPGLGFFESRNLKWATPPQLPSRIANGEAMHFSASSRTEELVFMSTSFFPNGDMQLNALEQLKLDLMFERGRCDNGRLSMVFVLESLTNASNTRQVEAVWQKNCIQNQWLSLSFLDLQNTAWSAYTLGLTGSDPLSIHAAALADPGFGAYRIQVARVNLRGSQSNVWLDNQFINDARLQERFHDFSTGSQYPNTPPGGDGFVAHIQFPEEQMSIAGDGAVLLSPDSSGEIQVRVTPYFDGRVQPDGSWGDTDGIYGKDPSYHLDTADSPGGYADILNVSFFDHFTGNTMNTGSLAHAGNGVYVGSVSLPAGFSGGIYTVVVNDNYPDTGGATGPDSPPAPHSDNRGSYYHLTKELLLRSGGAGAARQADFMDNPGHLAGDPLDTGIERGYEGPRSFVIIRGPDAP